MDILSIAKIIMIFLHYFFYHIFLRNYNSPENREKRCILKFERDFKIPLETPREEWVLILDLADNNYLKCMGIPQY